MAMDKILRGVLAVPLANWNGHGDLSEYCIGKIERPAARKPVSSAPVNSADAGPSRVRQAPSALSQAS
jgi:hypothetical protein